MKRFGLSREYENNGFIAIDVETTGFSPVRGDRVIEIGAVVFDHDGIKDEFQSLVNVEKRISLHARQVHGITEEMLTHAPAPGIVLHQLKEFMQHGVLVAHNAGFDIGFLRSEFARIGEGFNRQYHCTLELCRRRYPNLVNHRLETVCRHLFGDKVKNIRLHRALDDARMVARVWMAMMR